MKYIIQKLYQIIANKKQYNRFSKEDAIEIAALYHLEEEIRIAIDKYGLSPDDALKEWDCYPI